MIIFTIMYGRWILAVVLALCWAGVAAANAQLLWNKIREKDCHSSPVAITGALFALGALAACPWNNPIKWVLLAPALLLDLGSGFIIVMGGVALAGEGLAFLVRREGGSGLSTFEKRVARLSWIIKLGAAFLVWYLLIGAAISIPGWQGKTLTAVVVVYWPILLAWFWRLRKFRSLEKKP